MYTIRQTCYVRPTTIHRRIFYFMTYNIMLLLIFLLFLKHYNPLSPSTSDPSNHQPLLASILFSFSSGPLQPHQPIFFVVLPLPCSFHIVSHCFGGIPLLLILAIRPYHLTLSSCYEITVKWSVNVTR